MYIDEKKSKNHRYTSIMEHYGTFNNSYKQVSKHLKNRQREIKDINMGVSKYVKTYLLIGLWCAILFYHGYDYLILGKNYQVYEISKIIQLTITILITIIYLDRKFIIKLLLGKNYIGGNYIGNCMTTKQGIELNIVQTLIDCKMGGRIVKSDSDYYNFYGSYIKDKSIHDINEYTFFVLVNNSTRLGYIVVRVEYVKGEIKLLGEYTDSKTNTTEKIHLKRKDK